ncbi:DMT family transporter [Isoptericola jiangsuensis]|uniref:DMT family transporter n=1 Tax=Isoptericola jiangsuensis TaxID=548579 RepID=UPI003AAC17B7
MTRHGGLVAVVGAALLWSTSFAVTKVVLDQVGELTLGAIRFLAAAAVLAVVCAVTSQSLRGPVEDHRNAAALGLVGISAYFILENYGVAMATATDAALIVASYPVITMLGEWIVLRSSPSALMVVGAGVAFLGVFLVAYERAPEPAPDRGWGILLLVIGGVVWAAYNMMSARPASARTRQRFGVLGTTTLQNLWGGVGFCVAALVLPQSATSGVDGSSWVLVAYLALGCSALAFLLYTFGLTTMRPAQAVATLNLVPVFGVVWAVVIAGEQLTWVRVVGAVVIVAGVVMSTSSPRQPKTVGVLPEPRRTTKE